MIKDQAVGCGTCNMCIYEPEHICQ